VPVKRFDDVSEYRRDQTSGLTWPRCGTAGLWLFWIQNVEFVMKFREYREEKKPEKFAREHSDDTRVRDFWTFVVEFLLSSFSRFASPTFANTRPEQRNVPVFRLDTVWKSNIRTLQLLFSILRSCRKKNDEKKVFSDE